MRDPARIDEMIDELRKLWMEVPDWRLGQLIVNCVASSQPCPEIFNLEDDKMLAAIKATQNPDRSRKAMANRIDAVKRELATYAAEHGGRYIIYGSVARGDFRPDNDMDILVDFSEDKEDDAWKFAEEACHRFGIKQDIVAIKSMNREFVGRVMTYALVINGQKS